jgi:hypothetical protein
MEQRIGEERWTLSSRVAMGAVMASVITLTLLIYLLPLMAVLGAAAGWWFGVGTLRGAWQGAAFGLLAAASGWLLTFLRFAIHPAVAQRIRRDSPKA